MQPKPVQPGGPPLILGGMAWPALERIGLADGWVTSSRTDLSRIAEGIAVVKAAAEQAGRDPGKLRFICRGVVRAGAPASGQDSQRLLLSGSHLQIRDDTAWLAEQGVTEVFYDLNWDPQIGSPHADPDGRPPPSSSRPRPGASLAGLSSPSLSQASRPRCGSRSPPPRSGWPPPASPGCWTRARSRSWAR